MRVFKFNLICFFIIVANLANAHQSQDQSDQWVSMWITAINYTNENQLDKALSEYDKLINTLQKKQINDHLYLFIERGFVSNKLKKYQNAISDFTVVLISDKATKEEQIAALLGRSAAFYASNMAKEGSEDSKRLESLNPFVKILAITPHYMIFKFSSFFNDGDMQKQFIKNMIDFKMIASEKDVILTSSGMIILKKLQPCQACQSSINPNQ